MAPALKPSRAAQIALWVAVAMLAGYAAHAQFTIGGHGLDGLFQKWVNDAIVLLCAGLCVWRGLWLEIYPFAYAGLVLLLRSRVAGFRIGMWLDGIIGATSVASVSAAVVVQAVLRSGAHGTPAEVATNLAYPVGDLILPAMIVAALGVAGWRLDRSWLALGGGFVAFTVTDGLFLYQTAAGTYVVGTLVDAGWLLAAVMVAYAAWTPSPRRVTTTADGWRLLCIPALFAIAALGVLAYAGGARLNTLAIVLATCTLLTVIARMALTFRENLGMLRDVRREALTDVLTGLGNRRRLLVDLENRIAAADADPALLVMLDLNGFKPYNDSFGHMAGDALL